MLAGLDFQPRLEIVIEGEALADVGDSDMVAGGVLRLTGVRVGDGDPQFVAVLGNRNAHRTTLG